ncbi:hypothetical protein BDC45DRAFT_531778 [Circinella umbellata]|nr:hypothetical protein BDC45DRAFT_531778 [Circinella umbellata]
MVNVTSGKEKEYPRRFFGKSHYINKSYYSRIRRVFGTYTYRHRSLFNQRERLLCHQQQEDKEPFLFNKRSNVKLLEAYNHILEKIETISWKLYPIDGFYIAYHEH